MKRFTQLFLAAVFGGLFTVGLSQYFFPQSQEEFSLPTLQVQGQDRSLQNPPAALANYMTKLPTSLPDFTLVSEMSVNAVVHIRTKYEVQMGGRDRFLDDPIREFFFGPRRGEPQPRQREASGSGVIINPDGIIITNNHVVEGADVVEVTLNDNRQYEARIIGTDPTTDLAVIKIEEENLPHLSFGNSDEVRVGEWVLAIGNPFNLTSTVTAGIVSAKGRNINILGDMAIESFIQTDAAVNRGNSGGALVNTHGELIGINAAIASTTGTFAGYSFAIPSNIAQKVMEDLLEFGQVQRGLLGVTIRDLNSSLAGEMDIGINQGVFVVGVEDGSAAKEAGLKQGDVIIGIDGQAVRTTSELIENVGRKRPGDEVLVRYYREGKERETTAVLRNIHGEFAFITQHEKSILDKLGARFQVVPENRMQELNLSHGVQVTGLQQGKLRSAGIRDGFIITHVDREKIGSPEDLTRILKDKSGGVLIEGVYPNGTRAYYGIGMG